MRKAANDEFDGYRAGDLTYCVDPKSKALFPVRVVEISRHFLAVEPLDADFAETIAPEFATHPENRSFVRPRLPAVARFGGRDESVVNANRASGQELRLLPVHYHTHTNGRITELNATDPARWPLPTGTVYERWFKGAGDDQQPSGS